MSLILGVKNSISVSGTDYLITDHRPLMTLFEEHKCLPTVAGSRIQWWTIILSPYNYHIVYHKSEDHSSADELLHILHVRDSDVGTEEILVHIHALLNIHVHLNATQVARVTRTDRALSKVFRYIVKGRPGEVAEELRVYYAKRDKLSVEQGCVLWGTRVIVPFKLKRVVLKEIHTGYLGIVKMKALTCKYVWWSKVNTYVEKISKECETC